MACLFARVLRIRPLGQIVISGIQGWTKSVTYSPSLSSRMASSSSAASKMDISGIYPPIVTPFNADETIAYDKLQQNMEKWNKIPFRGYVVQGSNGEYVFLREDERIDLVRRVSEMAGKDKLIIAGAGCESTRDTIAMCEKMAKVGAEAVLVVTPSYYKSLMSNAALISHYTKVADASPVPVILYSVPGNTAIDLAPEVVIQLSSHPNIAGVKDSGGDIAKIGYMVHATKGNDFQVLSGSASFLLASYTLGGVGGVLALANILGEQCCDVEKLFKAGKMEEAKLLQHRLIDPNIMVTKKLGVPGLKRAMEMLGYYGGPSRSPLQPITKQNEEALRTVLTNEGFL
ncbi:4-hydroxy-2-oxoglutarate aldolase, mitochondrial-like [Ruditapes philippinarum]|uniref:4-hydroxy-2-oxoglutarate aldolase, mitochondrial-like n=1 Tax=Ruditapes philippinarum TaxID=129788 RepID=UPI00295A9016|nr:4-hydroxy-2-oxoglutarate aldolase, mitochondrial-like [Ruditapes philippinarum]